MSGFSIRPGEAKDVGDIALVHVTSWQETYRGLIPDQVLDSLSIEQWTERWRQILEDKTNTFHRIFIAQAAERVIGFASFGKEREGDPVYVGELYAIYLLKEFQRKGIGRSLIQNSALGLLDLGIQSMLVWVLSENPSRKFYETLGGIYLRNKPIEIGGLTLLESAYGWLDLKKLQSG